MLTLDGIWRNFFPLPFIQAPLQHPPSRRRKFSIRNGIYYFSSLSQLVTSTTGALLSVTEFNTRNRPSRDTS